MSEAQPSSSPAPAMYEPEPSLAPVMPGRQRTWVILGCIPEVVGREDKLVPGTDMSLEFKDPPHATILAVHKRVAPDPVVFTRDYRGFPYVVDVHPSGRLLLRATHGGESDDVYFLCDAHTCRATRLPACTEERVYPRRGGIGLIADPRGHGHYMVAALHPAASSSTHHEALVCYSTETDAWAVKELASSPRHPPWGSQGGVVAHDGKLWWVDLPHGLLTCDPFSYRPDLRYVALPEGCVMGADATSRARADLDKHRCVKAREGKLRYVEIHGLPGEQSVSMWTLAADLDGPAVWEHEYEVRFEDLWADRSYTAYGLPPQKVPAIALVHPKNHGVLYFFHGPRLFAVDMRASERRVLECETSSLMPHHEFPDEYHTARFVHAWELPATLVRLEPLIDEMKRPDEEYLPLMLDLLRTNDEVISSTISSLMMTETMAMRPGQVEVAPDQLEFMLANLERLVSDVPALTEESESSEAPSTDASDHDEEP